MLALPRDERAARPSSTGTDDGACWVGGQSGLPSIGFFGGSSAFEGEQAYVVGLYATWRVRVAP